LFYNECTKVIEESIHVIFDENKNYLANASLFDEFQLSTYADDEDR